METQDNGFLLVIDGVRKEKERLTAAKLFFLSFNPMVLSRLPALVLEDNKHKEEEGKRAGEKERCSGVIVCQIHRRIPQSRVASLLGSLS